MRARLSRLAFFVSAFGFSVAFLVGCSAQKLAKVKGVVRHQGQPLKAGLIKFHGADRTSSAMVQSDGSYQCDDVPWGEVKVTVEVIASGLPGERKTTGGTTGAPGGGMPGGGMPGGKTAGGGAPGAGVPATAPGTTKEKEKLVKPPEGAPPVPDAGAKLSDKYKKPETSELRYTIDAAEKNIDIDLK